MGRDPLFAFMNDAAARAIGIDCQSIVGLRVRDRFSDPSIEWWLETSDQGIPDRGADLHAERLFAMG